MSQDDAPMFYRKRPVVIQAMKWTGDNYQALSRFMGYEPIGKKGLDEQEGLVIDTLEGTSLANVGDYIIRGVKGEFYPCKEDVFKLTYDREGFRHVPGYNAT